MRETFRYSIFACLLTLALFLAPFNFISNAQLSGEPDVESMASALDNNQNRVLDDSEILSAIQLWILGEALPDGETISDASILSLVQLWITGAAISNPPPMGDDVGEMDGFYCPSVGHISGWGSEGTGDGQFNAPNGVAADHMNNKISVYVADSYNHRIQKFTSTGTFVTKWGSEGTGDGQFKLPLGVAVDNYGNVYIADSNNNRIQKFDSTGTYLTQWGSKGTGDGQFDSPAGVAMDKEDNVYIADIGNHRIQKFDSKGTFITKWGSEGTDDGQFDSPARVAVDYQSNVYVADIGNHRIQKFDSKGTFLDYGQLHSSDSGGDVQFNRPFGLAVDGQTVDRPGVVYVADSDNRIQEFDSSGTSISEFHFGGITNDFEQESTTVIGGIAADSTGVLYFADAGNHRIILGCARPRP